MEWLENLKEKLGDEGKQAQVKVKKVRRKDIQRNLRAIQDRMNLVHKDIDCVMKTMAGIDRTTEDGNQMYLTLEADLKVKNELYSTLQSEMKSEYDALKKHNDSRFTIQPEKGLMIGGVLFIGVFALALERENPKALKLAQFLLKLFPLHL